MAMARRWTPQRFVTLRRIRVIACIAATSIALAGSFAFTARKSVALNINGQTTQVTTYAMTATRLLEEQGVDIKTHDIVTTSSGDQLANHAVVTVQSAYQTTINIDGTSVPFWTVATSADQLLGFFEENQNNAAKITVDIKNVYNQLTGGLVINQSGPVTVIADGKSSVAPNGKLPAASILDSKGIVLNKEDRVNVEKDGDETILRVRRVTHGEETRTSVIPFSTQTIIDPNLAEGQADVRQQGVNGEKTQVYDVTYVDGVAESETLKSETVTSMAIDQIIAVGAAKSDTDKGSDKNPTPPITARPIPVSTISTSRPVTMPTTQATRTTAALATTRTPIPTTMPATPAATTPATPAIPVTLATPVTPATPATLVTPAAVRTTIPALPAPIQEQPPRPPADSGTPP